MSRPPPRGTLFVVATPIGNLDDVSKRSLEALGEAEVVLAEDTRVSRRLLERYGLHRPMLSLHRFNEASRLQKLIARLEQGEALALVTDGGTPAVSDPGARLVEGAHAVGARVVPVPGPSAVSAALSASGFGADRYVFGGFLPARPAQRRRALDDLARIGETLVLFEAPHRLVASLGDMVRVLGDRPAAICRELTKRHEEILRGTLSSIRSEFQKRERVRGEITLVIAGSTAARGEPESASDRALPALFAEALAAEDDDPKRAARRLARDLGISRAELKRRLERSRG
jgi:16S rRNA (cytidine1402-2'-O)-methyltransferase